MDEDDRLKVGDTVAFHDTWFYAGRGEVLEIQFAPTFAAKVRVDQIENAGAHFLGKETWLMAPTLEVIDDGEE